MAHDCDRPNPTQSPSEMPLRRGMTHKAKAVAKAPKRTFGFRALPGFAGAALSAPAQPPQWRPPAAITRPEGRDTDTRGAGPGRAEPAPLIPTRPAHESSSPAAEHQAPTPMRVGREAPMRYDPLPSPYVLRVHMGAAVDAQQQMSRSAKRNGPLRAAAPTRVHCTAKPLGSQGCASSGLCAVSVRPCGCGCCCLLILRAS